VRIKRDSIWHSLSSDSEVYVLLVTNYIMCNKWNLTKHNAIVQGIQEDFKQNDGENPFHTSSPTGAQIDYCAKLNWPDDAVAGADIPRRKYILLFWFKSPFFRLFFILWVLVQLKFRLFIE